MGWQEHATLRARDLQKLEDDALLTENLGALGGTGMTAYFGLSKLGKPFPGDTVVITGAAGATGSVAGQIAKIGGCKVIGIAGGPEKCAWLTEELGFDAAVDYKSEDVRKAVRRHAPGGIDVLWDNVGGEQLNVLLAHIALHARVVICGGIARYATDDMPGGPQNYFNLVFKRATMHGLLVLDYVSEFPMARARIAEWIHAGRIRTRFDMQHGLENAPQDPDPPFQRSEHRQATPESVEVYPSSLLFWRGTDASQGGRSRRFPRVTTSWRSRPRRS